jgi:hypothetical protein
MVGPRPGLSWADLNKKRNQQDRLEAEDVQFSSGAADLSRHREAAALAALVEQE